MPLYASLFFYLKGKISYFTMKKNIKIATPFNLGNAK
jgi:hypothetical protein